MSNELGDKLDVLIKLQAASLTAKMDSVKEKIIFLSKAGLRNKLIAEVLSVNPHNVDVTLSAARKTQKNKTNLKSEKKS